MSFTSAQKLENEPNELCFDEKVFLKETFSIDSFLREHRHKSTLEGLRDDLGTYLKILRMSMIDLINKDYEDFVNLSKDLVGLDKNIEALELSLSSIRQDIEMVLRELEETVRGVRQCLEQENEIARSKNSLIYLSQVLSSTRKLQHLLHGPTKIFNLDIVERAATEFNQIEFAKRKCQPILTLDQSNDCDSIGKLLLTALSNTFLECICENHQPELGRCLRIFSSLDKVSAAEMLIRDEVVAPFLNEIIRDSYLQKEGLGGIYQRLINFLDGQMSGLLLADTTQEFHFILNSFWLELERRFELYLSTIFAPGDPHVFQQRFVESYQFFDKLEEKCKTREQVDLLRSHPQTVHFFHKWNLPVYFKIRFQEIAGRLELVLADSTISTLVENSDSIYKLKSSYAVSKALESCWNDGIYLPQLADQFWKLSLQILSRFIVWVSDELNIKKVTHHRNKSGDSITFAIQPPTQSPAYHSQLNSFVRLYLDVEVLSTSSSEILTSAITKIPMSSDTLNKSVNECMENLKSLLSRITLSIVTTIVTESCAYLDQSRDIPRLYRLTNRQSPTRACDYVSHAVKLPSEFLAELRGVDSSIISEWTSRIFAEMAAQFHQRVAEVLTNAEKTEVSLMRLKKVKGVKITNPEPTGLKVPGVNTASSGLPPAENAGIKIADVKTTDDDKIRKQLLVDVQTFRAEAEKLGVDFKNCQKLMELVELVESAREKSLER